jgi:hypothetical protein
VGWLSANVSKDIFPTRRSDAKLGIPSATLKRYEACSGLFYQMFSQEESEMIPGGTDIDRESVSDFTDRQFSGSVKEHFQNILGD